MSSTSQEKLIEYDSHDLNIKTTLTCHLIHFIMIDYCPLLHYKNFIY